MPGDPAAHAGRIKAPQRAGRHRAGHPVAVRARHPGGVEAEHRVAGRAQPAARDQADHQRAGRQAGAVDHHPVAARPHPLVAGDVVADHAAGVRGDQHVRQSRSGRGQREGRAEKQCERPHSHSPRDPALSEQRLSLSLNRGETLISTHQR
ncbi:hypothetical protein A33M_1132 [Rhodovulum sp. PH10]|nr:hypothetical protein A33M_1132 [Rhodovulum sp. PH10]